MFTLNEALSAVKRKTEFGVHRREFGWVIDYNVALKDTFIGRDERETLILKNLRGTCFNSAGEIISLAFDKFHNLNECDGWRESDIDFSKPHHLTEKLDGSMIRAIPMPNGGYRLGTRAGITEVAMKAEAHLESLSSEMKEAYKNFITDCIEDQLTPIFEFCSRAQRIVIDYPEASLTLVAVRMNESGQYLKQKDVSRIAVSQGLPVVKTVSVDVDSRDVSYAAKLASIVRAWTSGEGIVVTFDDGFRVKIKSDDYCLKHKAIDGLRFEKDVVKLIMKGEVDDILPIVDENTRARLMKFRESLMMNVLHHEETIYSVYEKLKHLERREFAEEAKKQGKYAKFLFTLHDGKDPRFKDYVISKCGTQANLESIRSFVGKSYMEF